MEWPNEKVALLFMAVLVDFEKKMLEHLLGGHLFHRNCIIQGDPKKRYYVTLYFCKGNSPVFSCPVPIFSRFVVLI